MKFFDSLGPNPRVVRMFLLEKGRQLPSEQVDILKAENRAEAYRQKNPAGQTPCLQLDDGSYLAEVTAICEYLEEQQPEPALVGRTAEERARTRMWLRRADLNICEPMGNGFRYAEGLEMFRQRIHVIPEAAAGLKELARRNLRWLDGLLTGPWLDGDRFTLADIHLYCFLDFATGVGQPLEPANRNLAAWLGRIGARPSAEQSLHAAARAGGMRA